MTDIVERLRELERVERELAHDGDCPPEATANWRYAETCKSAADEIERLRAALEPFANALKGNWSHQPDSLPIVAGYGAYDLRLGFTLGDFRRASAALQQEKKYED